MKRAFAMALVGIGFFGSPQVTRADIIFTNVGIPGSPFGINNAGQIVGTSLGGEQTTGYLYSGGVLQTLQVPGSSNTFAYGINDSDEIGGSATSLAGTSGFIYVDGSFETINVPGGTGTTVRGINDAGQTVGYFSEATGHQIGFLNNGGDLFTQISVPGAFSTFPNRTNTAGQVVGYFTDSVGHTSGFLYSRGTYYTLNVPESSDTFVYGINDSGQTVGSFIDSTGTHGFLESNGIFTTFDAPDTLPTAGTFARDINNAGQILVFGSGAGTFLATPAPPVPEPSMLSLTGVAIIAILILKRRVPWTP